MSAATVENASDSSFLERIGEKFTALGDGFMRLLTSIWGSSNDREIAALGYKRTKDPNKPWVIIPGSALDRINSLEERMAALTDTELKEQSDRFRQRLRDGETTDDILPEAFAACREAGKRAKRMRHYDVQMLGGMVLHQGGIAEMVTGEGKTLVATLPAYLNALTGLGVHVITVNDYLARRDCEWMLPIYQALGVSAGFIQSDMDASFRRRAYEADITYGTNSEFGFDYLRDNMKPARWGDPLYPIHVQQVQRGLHFAIIDEVDNILIDEARTPLIISGPSFTDVRRYEDANRIAVQLTELQKREGEGKYFEVKEKERTCHLTDEGIRKAEELAGVESFYTAGNMEWPHLIDNALKAHHMYKKDKNYMVMRSNEPPHELGIVIIDEFTGRAMFGRQWSDGLHQAVEAKHAREGVRIKQETQTLATITLQNFFKLYKKLAGMTGTAITEANEFWKTYKLNVVAIPTNRVLKRINYPDLVYATEREKWDAILEEIERVHKYDSLIMRDGNILKGEILSRSDDEIVFKVHDSKEKIAVARKDIERIEEKGRPILIGTTDVAKSERLSAMLKRHGIKHELLNAKPEYVARESEIVAQAGRLGAVTIATNMAGRGTDIILGGNPETLAWAQLRDKYPTRLEVPEDVWKETVEAIEAKEKMKEEGRKVAEMGGLHIIGTERHESRRIDNQLRGRSGRQGDPGTSRFYVSLDDDLMRIFAGETVRALIRRAMEPGVPMESRMLTRRIEKAQKKVEEMHFDQRKNLLEYDEVMDYQRRRVYGKRQSILEGANCKVMILEMVAKQIDSAIGRFLDPNYGPASFADFAANRLSVEFDASDFKGATFEEAKQIAQERAIQMIPAVVQECLDENMSVDEEEREWKYQEVSRVFNARYALKLTDREIKKIGRDGLMDYVTKKATDYIEKIDLSDGKKFLAPDWGVRSLCDWAKAKFQVVIDPTALTDKSNREIVAHILDRVQEMIRAREAEFPVKVGMALYMPEQKQTSGGNRLDREGLFRWAKQRFPAFADSLNEDDFRTESRARLKERIAEISRQAFPTVPQTDLDKYLDDSLANATVADGEDSKEIASWAKEKFGLDFMSEEFIGLSYEQARQKLWNAFDQKYRPEMARMERSVVLGQLDAAWKTHLLTMDHLRAGIGLVGYAQIDPKTEYKRQGMKEFEQLWINVEDKVTDIVFRMEDAGGEETFQDALWEIQAATHAQAQSLSSVMASRTANTVEGTTNQAVEKKAEPIRNSSQKVGRNDPCPCGSGKKFKNCHMRSEVKK